MFYKNSTNDCELENVNEISDSLSPVDLSEIIYLSSIALFKMIKYTKEGVPVEVMGLLVGEYSNENDYILIKDVFGMPQSGTGVSVEATDPVFQTKMLNMLRQIGILDTIVGWYHSHPGFGCWLSGVDINTQQNFEQLNKGAVAIVIDPIRSIKNKITIECFRLCCLHKNQKIYSVSCMQTLVSNFLISRNEHGLNRYYFSLNIVFKNTTVECAIFFSLYEKIWSKELSSLPEFFSYFCEKKCLNVYKKVFSLIRKFISKQASLLYKFSIKKNQKIKLIFNKLKTKLRLILIELIVNYIKNLIRVLL